MSRSNVFSRNVFSFVLYVNIISDGAVYDYLSGVYAQIAQGIFPNNKVIVYKEMLEAIATLQAELEGSELVEVVLSEPESSDEGLF